MPKRKITTIIKKLWDYIEGVNGLILIIYTSFILSTQAIIDKEGKYILRWIFIIVIASFIVCPLLLKLAKKLDIKLKGYNEVKAKWKYKLIFFLIPFVLFFAMYIIYYPGGILADLVAQYDQAVHNTYTDWHPTIQTLFALKLPMILTGGWEGSMALFQIILLSLTIAYASCIIIKYTNIKYAVVALAFILINPNTLTLSICPLKDVTFAMGTVLLMVFALHIYMTKGAWIQKKSNCAVFIIIFAFTTLVRHNAILFTIPLLIAVLFLSQKKKVFIVISICVIALVMLVKVPLYNSLDVQQPNRRQLETLGLPLNVIAASVKYSPQTTDKDIKEFAYKIAPKEIYDEKYTYGNFNIVKFDIKSNQDVLDNQYDTQTVLSYARRCAMANPKVALKSIIKTTDTVYSITDDYKIDYIPFIANNENGLKQKGFPALKELRFHISSIIMFFFPHLFLYLGSMHLILLISMLAKFRLNNWKDWKRILLAVPVFAYNYISALLLTHSEEAQRYFWYTFLLMPILLLIIYGKNSKKNDEIEIGD